jgi:hypothetical protein
MHRGFFARALSDHPKDPLGSQFGSSVIAAYRSAGALIALVRNLHSQLKDTAERMWFLWAHVFSSAVCASILNVIVSELLIGHRSYSGVLLRGLPVLALHRQHLFSWILLVISLPKRHKGSARRRYSHVL